MRAIEKIKEILREIQNNREVYVQNPNRDFTSSRKVTFFDMMWFLIFIGANSMSKEIRRAIFKSRSKIKISIENLKTYKGYGLQFALRCQK